VEKGDDLRRAVLREVREETGYPVKVGRVLDAVYVRHRPRSGGAFVDVVVCFEVSTRSRREPRLDPQEHTEYAWVSRSEIRTHPTQPHYRPWILRAFSEGRPKARA